MVVGLHCLIGLLLPAHTACPRQIPLLRRKIEAVFSSAQLSPNSHSGRVVANILDNFPRDTLFQIGIDDLLSTTLGVLGLQERQRTRLFVMPDPFRRFFACLVYLPRERLQPRGPHRHPGDPGRGVGRLPMWCSRRSFRSPSWRDPFRGAHQRAQRPFTSRSSRIASWRPRSPGRTVCVPHCSARWKGPGGTLSARIRGGFPVAIAGTTTHESPSGHQRIPSTHVSTGIGRAPLSR